MAQIHREIRAIYPGTAALRRIRLASLVQSERKDVEVADRRSPTVGETDKSGSPLHVRLNPTPLVSPLEFHTCVSYQEELL